MYFKLIDRVEINPTEMCNLKCSFCPRSSGYSNRNLNMSVDTCSEIRRQLDSCGYNNKVSITGRGEPTLTNNFSDILSTMLLNNPRYDVYMNTNGKRLDQFEGWFEYFWRINLDVYDVCEQAYQQAIEKYSKWNNIEVRHRPDTGDGYIDYNRRSNSMFSNRAGGNTESTSNTHDNSPCGFLFNKVFINWNGDYNLCCDDWNNQMVMSNIWEENIVEYVDTNTKLKHYRDMHMKGKRDCLRVCGGCDRVAAINFKDKKDSCANGDILILS